MTERKELIFVASHLGYPMERTPLGGGAMVGLQLARAWAAMSGFRLAVVGSGPQAPGAGIEYHRLPGGDHDLVRLSELGYARFCRRFEAATTDFLLRRRAGGRPACVVVNDISESPDLARVAAAGYPIASIWHVDVVDYFNRMYLGGRVAPERIVRAFEAVRPVAAWAMPDVLKLVFEKQRRAVIHSARIVVPSRAMVGTIARCYAGIAPEVEARAVVTPWGGWDEAAGDGAAVRAEALRREHGLEPGVPVLMTLSRISPEKGIHVLLEALRHLEESRSGPRELRLFICGEAAFMRGAAYERRLRALAARLRRYRVTFPGYVAGAEKRAYLELADLFVSPSVHDSYALTLVEALRAGLPVLASEHYGVGEILCAPEATDPRRGFARTVRYAGADPSPALGAAVADLLSDPARLAAMGARAASAGAAMGFPEAARRIADVCLEEAR